eukprot:g16953.t1
MLSKAGPHILLITHEMMQAEKKKDTAKQKRFREQVENSSFEWARENIHIAEDEDEDSQLPATFLGYASHFYPICKAACDPDEIQMQRDMAESHYQFYRLLEALGSRKDDEDLHEEAPRCARLFLKPNLQASDKLTGPEMQTLFQQGRWRIWRQIATGFMKYFHKSPEHRAAAFKLLSKCCNCFFF